MIESFLDRNAVTPLPDLDAIGHHQDLGITGEARNPPPVTASTTMRDTLRGEPAGNVGLRCQRASLFESSQFIKGLRSQSPEHSSGLSIQ